MKILNIYAQDSEHTDARIVGNREGLMALQMAIVRALVEPGAQVDPHPDQEPLFASDGEGFEVIVEVHNDSWGLVGDTGKEDPNSFWAKPESAPQYLYKLRAVVLPLLKDDQVTPFIKEARAFARKGAREGTVDFEGRLLAFAMGKQRDMDEEAIRNGGN